MSTHSNVFFDTGRAAFLVCVRCVVTTVFSGFFPFLYCEEKKIRGMCCASRPRIQIRCIFSLNKSAPNNSQDRARDVHKSSVELIVTMIIMCTRNGRVRIILEGISRRRDVKKSRAVCNTTRRGLGISKTRFGVRARTVRP